MRSYLDLLTTILQTGRYKEQRSVLTSTGTKPRALSVFGQHLHIDLREGFPLLTTKFVSLKNVIAELIWFLNGETNVKSLQAMGCNIWNAWADENGELGPVYGKQWRSFGETTTVDQIQYVLDGIREVIKNPWASVGRRLIVSAWSPVDLRDRPMKAPPACHTLFQFNVTENELSCQLYLRSADVFLGVPYNIASYALLTHIMARATGLIPTHLHITYGDVHIYEHHLEAVYEQVERIPKKLPKVQVIGLENHPDLKGLTHDNFILTDYEHCGSIKGEVTV